MNVILNIKVKNHNVKTHTLFGLQSMPVKTIMLEESRSGDVVFKFDSLNEVIYHTKQLKLIKRELMQLTKDMVNLNRSQIDWAVQVVPLIKNAKQRIIVM